MALTIRRAAQAVTVSAVVLICIMPLFAQGQGTVSASQGFGIVTGLLERTAAPNREDIEEQIRQLAFKPKRDREVVTFCAADGCVLVGFPTDDCCWISLLPAQGTTPFGDSSLAALMARAERVEISAPGIEVTLQMSSSTRKVGNSVATRSDALSFSLKNGAWTETYRTIRVTK